MKKLSWLLAAGFVLCVCAGQDSFFMLHLIGVCFRQRCDLVGFLLTDHRDLIHVRQSFTIDLAIHRLPGEAIFVHVMAF